MGDLFKGVHLLTQIEYNQLAANEELDPDVLYATPENVTELVRQHTEQISENSADIARNKADIENLKTSSGGSSEEVVEIKNTINEIILRDNTQDNRLTNLEDNYASKDYVLENGGKIDKITVNGVEQVISDKTVNIIVPDVSAIENKLSKTVTLDEAQTITGPKTFSEHIYIANADGTVDRISHLNNNFIIHSGATNSAVLNIDEGLSKIYAFNNELAFKSDIAEASGTTVRVGGEAVADLTFSSDPQTQIDLLSETSDEKVSKTGDTVTGELIADGGIVFGNNKVRAENSGNTFEIVHVENDSNKNVFNYTHGAVFTLNNSETPVVIQGLSDRPSYVSGSGVMSNLALESDVKTAIDGLGTVFDLKGTKETLSDLPSEGNSIGDVWYVTAEEVGYIWLNDGTTDRWERFGAPIDLSGYLQTSGGSITGDLSVSGTLSEGGNLLSNKYALQSNLPRTDELIGILTSTYVRITSLETGIYKWITSGPKYIYYSGSSSQATHRVEAGTAKEVYLFVTKYNTTRWNWYYVCGDFTQYAQLYSGTTTTSLGFVNSIALDTSSLVVDGSSSLLTSGGAYANTSRVTLNGTSMRTPSLYAPTTAGTNKYLLQSNGSGEPVWIEPMLNTEIVSGKPAEVENKNIYLIPRTGAVSGGMYEKYLATGTGNDVLEGTGVLSSLTYDTATHTAQVFTKNISEYKNPIIKLSFYHSTTDLVSDTIDVLISKSMLPYTLNDYHDDPITFVIDDVSDDGVMTYHYAEAFYNSWFTDVKAVAIYDGVYERLADITDLTYKANTDLSNVTYPKAIANGITQRGAGDRVVESYISSDGKTWYKKWESGWKECGGIYTISNQIASSSEVTVEITLPLQFSSTDYKVSTTTSWKASGGGHVLYYHERPKSTNSKITITALNVQAQAVPAASTAVEWECKGY